MRNVIVLITMFLSLLSVKTSIAGRMEQDSHQEAILSEKSIRKTACSKLACDTINLCCLGEPNKGLTTEEHSAFVSSKWMGVSLVKQKRPIALKSNLLYWVVGTPNISVDFYLSHHLSLCSEIDFAWWSGRDVRFYWQVFAVSPELRYWFCSAHPFQGHYVGVYVGSGLYDIMLKPLTGNKGFQGEFFLTAGLSYGYAFPIGKDLSLEGGIGIGYIITDYREYVWGCSEYMRTDTKRTTWIGPTKINLTLVWQLSR